MYEITFVDTGKTVTWSEAKCRKTFGKNEWLEIKENYLPHIVVAKLPPKRRT